MWTTINEPYVISVAGYDTGIKAVGRCSKWVNSRCQAGDSAIEPYIVSHHLLLSHAAAVQEFRNCNKVYYIHIFSIIYNSHIYTLTIEFESGLHGSGQKYTSSYLMEIFWWYCLIVLRNKSSVFHGTDFTRW